MMEIIKEYRKKQSFFKHMALDLNVSSPFLTGIFKGNQKISNKVSRFFGYEKVTMYKRVK